MEQEVLVFVVVELFISVVEYTVREEMKRSELLKVVNMRVEEAEVICGCNRGNYRGRVMNPRFSRARGGGIGVSADGNTNVSSGVICFNCQ